MKGFEVCSFFFRIFAELHHNGGIDFRAVEVRRGFEVFLGESFEGVCRGAVLQLGLEEVVGVNGILECEVCSITLGPRENEGGGLLLRDLI